MGCHTQRSCVLRYPFKCFLGSKKLPGRPSKAPKDDSHQGATCKVLSRKACVSSSQNDDRRRFSVVEGFKPHARREDTSVVTLFVLAFFYLFFGFCLLFPMYHFFAHIRTLQYLYRPHTRTNSSLDRQRVQILQQLLCPSLWIRSHDKSFSPNYCKARNSTVCRDINLAFDLDRKKIPQR